MRGEQIRAFREASGVTSVMSDERIKAGLDAARVPLTDSGVIVVLQVLDAAMDTLQPADRGRVANAFTRKYANTLSGAAAPDLSPREWAVLRALAAGMGTGGAAKQLGIAPRTVSTRIESLMQKLDANDRTHVVAEAFRRGML